MTSATGLITVPRVSRQKFLDITGQIQFFFPISPNVFNFLHLDLIGPLDKSNDYQYVLMIKDRATRLLVTAPIPNKTAITVRKAFLQNWVGHYGVPQVVLSDNGK